MRILIVDDHALVRRGMNYVVKEGFPVRISGQDVERGTFAHRHAVLTVEDSEEKYIPLQQIDPRQAPFHIYNSPLSEYGVLGFEYGYGLSAPKGVKNMTKIVAGKQLWNYDNLEPEEKKLVL